MSKRYSLKNEIQVCLRFIVLYVLAGVLTACSQQAENVDAETQPVTQTNKTIAGATNMQTQSGASLSDEQLKKLFNRSCVSCHLSGVAGAPRVGDSKVWRARIESKGMETLVKNVRRGLGAMPPMGMCPQCSDAEFEALIHWMSDVRP